ncbi:hypothetical protein AWB77_05623 [Caballeronia fortuita]|uniref:Uncharacterized protein n=1 Tax=Caballeronia fortuita TaxID=1777138 RepID=A0A158DPJ8_9BURK|nr:hypothetical protein [Caballeronia fortuita]SAK96532.1 hypothetical protein AWB77_05623 [Caballeronia fortuita]
MFLTSDQRIALMETAVLQQDADSRMAAIDALIAVLRQQNPNAFHTNVTLAQRVFYHEPDSDIPYLGVIKRQRLVSQEPVDDATRNA